MASSRRAFLEQLTGSALALTAVPSTLHAISGDAVSLSASAADWDLSWPARLKGKYKAVMDVPEVDSGYGVWRGSLWAAQYVDAMAAKPADCSTVVVLRHNGIALAMNQQFWDTYGLAKKHDAKHPVTGESTTRNPALLSSARGEVAASFDHLALDKFIARGGVALACNLAFADCVSLVAATDKVSEDAARAKATTMLVPGVIMQPSGVFAAIRAQQAGCAYVRAS